MTAQLKSVVPIFATPFAVADLDAAAGLNAAVEPLLLSRCTPAQRAAGAADPYSFRSRDDLGQWPEPAMQGLLRGILSGVIEAVRSISEIDAAQFAALRVDSRAWFTVISANGHVAPDSYANAAWCAIYCVAAPAASTTRHDSGVLRLHEPGRTTMYPDATNSALAMPYRFGHSAWRPVPGQFALFPGGMTHEIALLRSEGRLCLVTMLVRFFAAHQTGTIW